jgi:hypothetical protein
VFPLVASAEQNPVSLLTALPRALAAYGTNLDATLSALRAAEPDAVIVVCTYYNPVSGLKSNLLPAQAIQVVGVAVDEMNAIIRAKAARYRAVVAESGAALDNASGGAAAMTGMGAALASGNLTQLVSGIHPTPAGYALFGEAVVAALPYRFPLQLTVPASLRTHAKLRVGVESAPYARIVALLKLPGGRVRHATTVLPPSGTAGLSLRTGGRAGTGRLQVCVTTYSGGRRCMHRRVAIGSGLS